MPRYVYKCFECEQLSTIFHRISQIVEECPVCLKKDTLSKQLTTPMYKNKNEQKTQKVGELTKEFIEKNKEILEIEKSKREDYEPT